MKTLILATSVALSTLASLPAQAQSGEATMPLAGQAIRSYLLEHPEVIVEALQAYERNQKLEEISAMRDAVYANLDAILNAPGSPVMGNPDGDVTLVEFADYSCPHCRSTNAALREVMAADPDLRVVIKELPILGEASQLAARYAKAVYDLHGSEAYRTVHDALFDRAGQFDVAWLREHTAQMGFDFDEIEDRMFSSELLTEFNRTADLAKQIGITGTPFLIIGDEVVPGAIGTQDMRMLIAQERAQ
ncbi:DsbA family protein [Epibacterium sp. DP7N7-1]|nr:DsbA family protein [Epibacterium sp. DP7N7-1]